MGDRVDRDLPELVRGGVSPQLGCERVGGFVKRGDRDRADVKTFTNLYAKNFASSATEEEILDRRALIKTEALFTPPPNQADRLGQPATQLRQPAGRSRQPAA